MPKPLSIAEAKNVLGVSASTLYQLVARKEIGHMRIAARPGCKGKILFTDKDLEEFQARHRAEVVES